MPPTLVRSLNGPPTTPAWPNEYASAEPFCRVRSPPMVSVPGAAPTPPGASVPPVCTVTLPPSVPVPPRVAPLPTVAAPVPLCVPLT
ncbi:Uncharacterised protein [Achromobacter sp. 2789STDY5608615]|nr:Uncharacterised protein [Achromobacter sp. 2789STDY5608615]